MPQPTGGYRRLTGNEVGLLLGWRAAERCRRVAPAGDGTLACSIVSSPGLAAIARHYGLDFADTLTGFKWISRAPGLVFGFEEALGYLVNPDDGARQGRHLGGRRVPVARERAEGRRSHRRRAPRGLRRDVRRLRLVADLDARHRPRAHRRHHAATPRRAAVADRRHPCRPHRRPRRRLRRPAAERRAAHPVRPTARASWCARAAPSRSSRSTSTSSSDEGSVAERRRRHAASVAALDARHAGSAEVRRTRSAPRATAVSRAISSFAVISSRSK